MALFAIHSPFTLTAPQGYQISIARVSTLQGIFPGLPDWLSVKMVESAPGITGHHGSLSCSWVTQWASYSMQAKHSNSNMTLRITMLCFVPDKTGTKMTHLISFQNICKHLVSLSQPSPSCSQPHSTLSPYVTHTYLWWQRLPAV